MAYGICDVGQCQEKTYMGWRPHTVALGRQVCRGHWERHKNSLDGFSLFDAFGFQRPLIHPKPIPKAKPVIKREPEKTCSCGRPRRPRHQYCPSCAAERERIRKQEWQAQQEAPAAGPQQEAPRLQCRQCGEERPAGHTYCEKCAERREKQLHRERQRKYAKQAG
jgi:hypothetical protein